MSRQDEDGIAKRSLAALGWNYVGAIGRSIAQLGIQVALARILGPHAFGQATAAMIVLGFGWLISDAGFGSALVQRRQVTQNDIGYALGWILLTSVLMATAICLGSGVIATAFGDPTLVPLIIASAALIPFQALSNLPTNLMRRDLQMKRLQIIQLAGYVFCYGLIGLVLAETGFGPWSIVIAFAVQTVSNLVFTYLSVRHTLRPRLSGDSALRSFGLRVMATNISGWAIDNLDRVIVSRQWGATSLGEYSAASNLSRAPASLLTSSVQSVVFSSASKIQEEPERLARGFLAILGLISLLSLPVFAFLALHADIVAHTLYGNRWKGVGPLFAAFCVGLPFYAMLSVTGPVLWAIGAVSSELKVQLLTGVFIVGGLWLLSGWPLSSAIWIIPVLYLARVTLIYLSVAGRLQIKPARTIESLRGGLFCLAVTVATFSIFVFFTSPTLINLAIEAVVTGILCLAGLRFLSGSLIPRELTVVLLNRVSDSKSARLLCRLFGLR